MTGIFFGYARSELIAAVFLCGHLIHLLVKGVLEFLVVVIHFQLLVCGNTGVVLLHEVVGGKFDGNISFEIAVLGRHQLLADGADALQRLVYHLAVQALKLLLELLALVHGSGIGIVVGHCFHRSLDSLGELVARIGQRLLLGRHLVHAFADGVGAEDLVVREIIRTRAWNNHLRLAGRGLVLLAAFAATDKGSTDGHCYHR